MSNTVEKGDTVTIQYQGVIDGGQEFHSFDEEPMTAEIGSGKLIPGLDKAIVGMTEGEEKEVHVTPEEAYGNENPGLIQTIQPEHFEEINIKPEVGMIFKTPEGNCYISNVSEQGVELNYNHPYAGKSITFNIKIAEIKKA